MSDKEKRTSRDMHGEVEALFEDLSEQYHDTGVGQNYTLKGTRAHPIHDISKNNENGKIRDGLQDALEVDIASSFDHDEVEDTKEQGSLEALIGELPPADPNAEPPVVLEKLIPVVVSTAPVEESPTHTQEISIPVEPVVDEEFDKQTETEVAAKPQIMAEVPVSFERSEVVQSAAIPHSAVKVRSIKQAEKTSPSKNMIKDLLQTLVIALLLFVAINIVSARVLVDGNSMEPTLENLDRIIVNRLAYKFDDFSYGDVVVFPSPYNNYEDYIKRVIALPGDSIEIRSGQVFVNNRLLEEKYVLESPLEGLEKETMPPGMVFVMGDNRNASSDSRDWGPLPIDSIIGKAVFVYWPIDHVGAIPTPDVFFSTP